MGRKRATRSTSAPATAPEVERNGVDSRGREEKPPGCDIVWGDEIITGEVQWFVDGWFPSGGFTLVGGPPDAGKSTLFSRWLPTFAAAGRLALARPERRDGHSGTRRKRT